jgi:hypothetical protein
VGVGNTRIEVSPTYDELVDAVLTVVAGVREVEVARARNSDATAIHVASLVADGLVAVTNVSACGAEGHVGHDASNRGADERPAHEFE